MKSFIDSSVTWGRLPKCPEHSNPSLLTARSKVAGARLRKAQDELEMSRRTHAKARNSSWSGCQALGFGPIRDLFRRIQAVHVERPAAEKKDQQKHK